MIERKTDRRTVYTKNIIKDSFLELLKISGYDKITITAICKKAEITRATFYSHYNNIDEVLNETLDEALRLTELDSNISFGKNDTKDPDTLLPACQRAADNPKYRVLFLDKLLSHYILEKLYRRERNKRVSEIMKSHNVSEREADMIFIYMLNGSFAVNNALGWCKNSEWYQIQKTIHEIIK